MLESLQLVIDRATEQPRAVFETAGELLSDLVSITFGSSQIEPAPKDARFKDDAWRDNPIFRRMGQGYLAWGKSVDEWLAHVRISTTCSASSARFMLDIVKDLAAPMNTLPGNPEALRKAWDTRGDSLRKGLRNYVDDLRHNHGYPAVADRDAFKVGVDVCASAGSVVFCNELLEVIQYTPKTPDVHAVPLVYVFSQVNRFYLGRPDARPQPVPETARRRYSGVRRQLAQSDRKTTRLGPRYVRRRCDPGGFGRARNQRPAESEPDRRVRRRTHHGGRRGRARARAATTGWRRSRSSSTSSTTGRSIPTLACSSANVP